MADPLFPAGGTNLGARYIMTAGCPISGERIMAVAWAMSWPSNYATDDEDREAVIVYRDKATGYSGASTWSYDHAAMGASQSNPETVKPGGWGNPSWLAYGDHNVCYWAMPTWSDGHYTLVSVVGNQSDDNSGVSATNIVFNNTWILNQSMPEDSMADNGKNMNLNYRETTPMGLTAGPSAAISVIGTEERRYLYFLGNDGYLIGENLADYSVSPPDMSSKQFHARLAICWSDDPHWQVFNRVDLPSTYCLAPDDFDGGTLYTAGCCDDRGYYHCIAVVYQGPGVPGNGGNELTQKLIYIKPTGPVTWANPEVIYETSSTSKSIGSPGICYDKKNKALVLLWTSDKGSGGIFTQSSFNYGNAWQKTVTLGINETANPFNPSASIAANDKGEVMVVVANWIRAGDNNPHYFWWKSATSGGILWSDWTLITGTNVDSIKSIYDDYVDHCAWSKLNLSGSKCGFSLGIITYTYLQPNATRQYKWLSGAPDAVPSLTYSDAGFGSWVSLYTSHLPAAAGRDTGPSQYGTDILASGSRVLVVDYNAYSVSGSANEFSHILHYSDNGGTSWTNIDIWPYTSVATNGFGYDAYENTSSGWVACSLLCKDSSTGNLYYICNTRNDEAVASDRIAVQKSTDNGTTWASRVIDTSRHMRVIAAAASSNGLFIVGCEYMQREEGGPEEGEYFIMRSTNEGSSWTQLGTNIKYDVTLFEQSIAVDSNGFAHILVAGVDISTGKSVCAYYRPTSASTWVKNLIYESDYYWTPCFNCQILIRGTNVLMFFQTGVSSVVNLWLVRSTNTGVSLGNPSKVFSRFKSDSGQGMYGKAAITADNRTHLFIASSRRIDRISPTNAEHDFYMQSTSFGASWTTPMNVANNNAVVPWVVSGSSNWERFKIVPAPSGSTVYLAAYGTADDSVAFGKRL